MENDIKSGRPTCCGMCGEQPTYLMRHGALGVICMPCLIAVHDAAMDFQTAIDVPNSAPVAARQPVLRRVK
jgi:hypothetical protein